MDALGNIQKSLDDLKEFVDHQKTKLKTEQVTLEHILEQKQRLKPLLKADQEVVDALFKIQEEKNRKQKWVDRSIGFVGGFITSFIAAIIIIIIERKILRIEKA